MNTITASIATPDILLETEIQQFHIIDVLKENVKDIK